MIGDEDLPPLLSTMESMASEVRRIVQAKDDRIAVLEAECASLRKDIQGLIETMGAVPADKE